MAGSKYIACVPGKTERRQARQAALYDVLRGATEPLTRAQIFDVVKRNYTRAEVDSGIEKLLRDGLAKRTDQDHACRGHEATYQAVA